MSKTPIIDKIIIALAVMMLVILMIAAKNIYTLGVEQQPANDLICIKNWRQICTLT